MRHIVKTEEEWHGLRDGCITASEAAVLVGLNPYMSPSKLKIKDGFKGNAYTFVGQVLEPVVVDVTNRVLGTKFALYEVLNAGKVFYVKGRLGATPDAMDGDWLLECKSTRPDTFLKYLKAPPSNYVIQVQTQLYCTDKKEAYLAILSTDLTQKSQEIKWPLIIYKIVRNDKLCAILNTEAERFYTEESFRVNSAIKRQATTLMQMSIEKVWPVTEVSVIDKLKEFLK